MKLELMGRASRRHRERSLTQCANMERIHISEHGDA